MNNKIKAIIMITAATVFCSYSAYSFSDEYEPIYPYNLENSRKPYTPDFIIRQGDKEAYIEHFGVTEDGKNDRYLSENYRY